MRVAAFFAVCGLACAQIQDPAHEALTCAYEALRARNYDAAIAGFQRGIEAAPRRPSIRKDLAYTYLKVGENLLAREEFRAAMEMDPADTKVALEYAFLCYETGQQAQARRIFDRIRKTGNATAEQAFRNIDAPLAAGIERWKKAIALGVDSFSVHFELAKLAEQRDDLPLASEQYEKAWRILPDRRSVLVDLGRVWKAQGRSLEANAALLAASRGGEPRAAEMGREMLPARYPFVPEFRSALVLDSANIELRRELGYLLLRMGRESEAEDEFRTLTAIAPNDLLAATQLGFLLYARGQAGQAMPLFERVMAGPDNELANRVRAVLRLPQVVTPQPVPPSIDAKVMAERSIKAGYMKDALKYLQLAHDADPADFTVMLKLGWTYNILHQDIQAYRWFDLARKSPDPTVASQADRAWHNLVSEEERFRTVAWFFPVFSTRWHDVFGYSQFKEEVRTGIGLRPYVSVRFVGDAKGNVGVAGPLYLSENSVIAALGVTSEPWRGITGWAEAGGAIGYRNGHILSDYRGGVSAARGLGHPLGGEAAGWFADTTLDGVFISRFDNDLLVYSQSRAGYTLAPSGPKAQFYWNANLTFDAGRQYWANFVETGPGIRFRPAAMPPSMFITLNLVRGAYLINAGNPRRPNYNDFRVGVWYAFVH